MKTARPFIAGIFLAAVFLGVFPPQPAPVHAQFGGIVHDPINGAIETITQGYNLISSTATNLLANKEMVLDPIAWSVAKIAVASMTRSMVNWINSGFNGSPAFVTNLQVSISNVGFATENSFINQLSGNAAIRSPFQSQVASLLNVNYLKSSASNGFFLSNPYTLNQVSTNPTGFVNGTTDFTSGGGWNAWFSLTTQPQNNVYGAYNLAQNELNARISTSQNNFLTQLGWGQGFLSWCGNTTSTGGGTSAGGACTTDDDCGGVLACIRGICTIDSSLGNPASTCTNKDGSTGTIQTPGSVIQAQLNKTLGLSGDSLVTADEFGEVIGALMGQLVNQVVGTTGLSGAASVSSGGTGYVDQAVAQQSVAAATAASSAAAAISNAITGQLQQVTIYQSSWQAIGNAATAASVALASCPSAPAGAAAAVSSAQSQASAASAEANTAISSLSQVRNEVTSAGTNATASAKASSDYQALIASPSIPSGSDVAFATAQAQDNSVGATPSTVLSSLTLYGQMQFIAGICSGAIH